MVCARVYEGTPVAQAVPEAAESSIAIARLAAAPAAEIDHDVGRGAHACAWAVAAPRRASTYVRRNRERTRTRARARARVPAGIPD
jgi:hypothetical protein